jgi:hypothetical protein
MRKGRRVLLIVGGLAAACLLVVVLSPSEKEPEYHGKKLSKWVLALDDPRPSDEAADPAGASEAIRALGTNAIPLLVKWIAYDPSDYRVNFSKLLAGLRFDPRQRSLRRLEGRTANSVTAFRCLGSVGVPAIPQLYFIMINGPSISATTRARDSLAFIGEPAVPFLLTALTNNQYQLRSQIPGTFAFMGMQGIDVRPAIPILISLLKDADQLTSESCAGALAQLGRYGMERDTIVAALIEATHDAKPKVRRQAVIALSKLGDPSKTVIEALIHSMDDPEMEVAMYATQVLPRWQSFSQLAVPALIKRLKPNDAIAIRTQMDSLAHFGPKARAAVPALLGIMDKPLSPSVWIAASNAVWRIEPEVLQK